MSEVARLKNLRGHFTRRVVVVGVGEGTQRRCRWFYPRFGIRVQYFGVDGVREPEWRPSYGH